MISGGSPPDIHLLPAGITDGAFLLMTKPARRRFHDPIIAKFQSDAAQMGMSYEFINSKKAR
jgi:hypothetical protein